MMGKRFDTELEQLEHTYKWAIGVDVSKISCLIRNSCGLPLLSVGSGGSLSAAEFQALLHRTLFSSIGQAVTPVELISMLPRNREVAVWFMSANGDNIDISRAFKHTALHEMKFVSALVCRKESKLHKLSTEYEYTKCFQFPIPSGKDGFLATNSLLVFLVILYRAYGEVIKEVNKTVGLSKTLNALIRKCLANFSGLKDIKKNAAPLCNKKSIHVLYSLDLKPAALDIESKFTEAGLISSHLADIRNFAHGRHNWFSKYEADSGVIALSTNNDYKVIEKTLALLPNTIPKTHISFNYLGGVEVIVGIVLSMHLTNWLGKERGIDPGRPGIASFGSKIYRLAANPGFVTSVKKKEAAIERKRKLAPLNYGNRSEQLWVDAHNKFTRKLAAANIGGVVLDYDGTVVDSDKRWDPPGARMISELIRLLEENMVIGFATGRGDSIRDDLQQVIPKKLWGKILIGYYNGAELKHLLENTDLRTASDPIPELKLLSTKLKKNIFLHSVADFKQKEYQLTVKSKENKPLSETFLWDLVQDEFHQYLEHKGDELSEFSGHRAKILRSSHSVDIIAGDVSKLSVVKAIRQNIQENSEILNIGDRGRWPGNDAELLKETLSLSVDEVSYSSETCWNLCPAGIRGAQGTLYYLSRLKRKNGTMRFFP